VESDQVASPQPELFANVERHVKVPYSTFRSGDGLWLTYGLRKSPIW